MDTNMEQNTAFGKPLISVIVPVYNVKECLRSSLDSILAQTYTNLEILLVDDGSTDGSGELCDEYAGKDARIKVIHQEYKGVSEARNTAIDQSKGDYISFIDADDLVAETFLQTLYQLLEKYGADIAACSYSRRSMKEAPTVAAFTDAAGRKPGTDSGTRNGIDKSPVSHMEICMDGEAWLRNWHGTYKKYETVIWNKLYRREVLGSGKDAVRFPVGRFHEDTMRTHLFVERAKKVVLTDRELYIYRKREGSITNSGISKAYAENNLAAQRERMQYFKERRYYKSLFHLWKGYMLHKIWFAVRKRTA